MVKHRFLGNARIDKGLRIREGVYAYNYYDLLSALKEMSDAEFKDLITEKHSFFTDWILDEIEDALLSSKLKKCSSRKKYISLLSERIKELEAESEEVSGLLEKKRVLQERKNKIFPYVWFAVYGVLIAALLLQYSYYEERIDILSAESDFFYKELMETNKEIFSLHDELIEKEESVERLEYLLKEFEERNEALLRQINVLALDPILTPASRVSREDILLKQDEIIIRIDNPVSTSIADTGSMLPLISHDTKVIQIQPSNHSEIQPGDIISFDNGEGRRIIHRVIETGFDEEGWYAVTKGDNALLEDSERVRFSQIRRVLVAIIY